MDFLKYFTDRIGRKGTLCLFVFISVCAISFSPIDADKYGDFLDFAVYICGIFTGTNVFEHWAKRGK